MTLSEFLHDVWGELKVPQYYADFMSGLPETILNLEIKQSEDVCRLSFYPWMRERCGYDALLNIVEDYDEYSYNHSNIYVHVAKNVSPFFIMQLLGDDGQSEVSLC